MPDKSDHHKRAHPVKRLPPRGGDDNAAGRGTFRRAGYAELRCKSNFSFLRGASHPEEIVQRAAELGYAAIAVTDRNTLAGVVRMHCAAKARGVKLIIGAELTPTDAPPITLYATDRASYGRLARIITQGRLREIKGSCAVVLEDIAAHNQGLLAAVHGDVATCGNFKELAAAVRSYRYIFGDRLYLAVSTHKGADDERYLAEIDDLARAMGVRAFATNDVHYHAPHRRFLQDVLTCIREKCTLEDAGRRLLPNAERYLKPAEEMERLFAKYPKALARTLEIAERCSFNLDELRYEYPEALCPPGRAPYDFLAELTWAGACGRYPDGLPDKVRTLIEHELVLIRRLKYEPYFLTVWDIVKFARACGILCQGRGSAANSAVCYCLGITSVDPDRIDLLFERFVSAERNEPPDIDVDFEHERREEVFQYIYDKYGREHAGIVAEVITYRPRSAIRDAGKALGLSLDHTDALAKKHEWWDENAVPPDFVREAGLDPADRTVLMLRKLVRQLIGFPRHLSQHVGGFVITRGPLCEMVPLENGAMPGRTFIEWDKDDIDALGILKIDCLALGMLTAINKCFRLLQRYHGEGTWDRVIKGTRDQGNKGSRKATRGADNGKQEYLSGLDCMAKGDSAYQAGLSSLADHAASGKIRSHNADAARRRFSSEQYCRGKRPAVNPRLSSFFEHRPRFVGGVGDADHHCARTEDDRQYGISDGVTTGNAANSPGPYRKSPKKADEANQAALTVPAFSSATPRSLDPSIPRSLESVPPEDPAVYDMICRADTVGVFQIESRAQMSMLPRLEPRRFYDLVIEVAIVRPGPIQGGMVHPYLRRRRGEEPVTYPSEAIKEVLHRTLGVPLFQEQAMRLAVVAAGFTPGEADQLRRAMGAWRRSGEITRFRAKLIDGMKKNGLSEEFAERCFKQICGFGEYGFPESHAASFALLVYVSAWLKRYHPAAFCAAIVNSLPMGFYEPAQLVRDAREHGVDVRGVDVNFSGYDCRLERRVGTAHRFQPTITNPSRDREGAKVGTTHQHCVSHRCDDPSTWGLGGPAVRLGIRLVKGISPAQVERIEHAQRDGPFTSVADLAKRSGVSRATLARLAAADAVQSLGLSRREAVWKVLALADEAPMFDGTEPAESDPNLPIMSVKETVYADYDRLGLSLHAHPMSLIREEMSRMGVQTSKALRNSCQGKWIKVAGLVLIRQRPSTALGIVFCTLEDETGTANLVIRPTIFQKYRRAAHAAVALVAEGRVERRGEVVHLQVSKLEDMSKALHKLRSIPRDFH